MFEVLRRYLVLGGLLFWLGGFTFYASVVVPVGTEALGGSTLRQGFITREVTRYLNVSAAVALGLLAWDLLATRDPSRLRCRARVALWLATAVCQVALFALHAYLDARLQKRGMIILEPEVFRTAHRAYLWTHTAQWFAALAFVWLMLLAWRGQDRT
jgi:hypothetical protein